MVLQHDNTLTHTPEAMKTYEVTLANAPHYMTFLVMAESEESAMDLTLELSDHEEQAQEEFEMQFASDGSPTVHDVMTREQFDYSVSLVEETTEPDSFNGIKMVDSGGNG